MNAGHPAAADDAVARFVALLKQCLAAGHVQHLLLANPTVAADGLQRVVGRLVHIKGELHMSFTLSEPTRDLTRNLRPDEALAQVQAWAGTAFRNLHLFEPSAEWQLAFNRKGRASLRKGKAAAAQGGATAADAAHNREKQRMLSTLTPFLQALGVADARGQLVPAMARKYRQINRFVEVLDGALRGLRPRVLASGEACPIEVADFGCGKGYLTFAVHEHLTRTLVQPAHVVGVELREDMVSLCNAVARRLQCRGLEFEAGDMAGFAPRALDVVIALHACDTATDQAIHLGVRAGAQVIVCSPCCHKQLRAQLLAPSPIRAVLQHGIHLGQEAEMVTDSLRALLLQAQGYATQVFEFVALEHTAKNKMILAVKGGTGAVPERGEVLRQVAEVKAFYGIREQALESLLAAESEA